MIIEHLSSLQFDFKSLSLNTNPFFSRSVLSLRRSFVSIKTTRTEAQRSERPAGRTNGRTDGP